MANRSMYGPPAASLLPPAPQTSGGFFRPGAHNLLLGAGLGLLSQGPSLTPQSPFAGLGQGLMMGSALNQTAMQGQRADQRIAMEQQKFQAQQAAAAQAAQQAAAEQEAAIAALVAQNPDMDPMLARNLTTAGAAGSYLKPQDPFFGTKSVPGVGLVRMGEEGPETIIEAKPTTQINLDSRKPVGDKATKYVMPDGSTPPIDATPAEIASAGGRALSPEEQAARTERAKQQVILEQLDSEVARAQDNYNAAQTAFATVPDETTKRNLDQAANALSRAKAGRANWRGEPSGDVARDFREPGAFRGMAEDFIGGLVRPQPLPSAAPIARSPVAGGGSAETAPPEGFSAEEWEAYKALEKRLGLGG